MAVQTRYFRNDQHTVNTITAYQLSRPNTDSLLYITHVERRQKECYWGVRVYVVDVLGAMTELTSDVYLIESITPSVHIFFDYVSNTWSCPLTALSDTDAVLVEVYIRIGSGRWDLYETFITEQLHATQLDAATWTFYLMAFCIYDPTPNQTSMGFYWGKTAGYNSRITNFQLSFPPVTVIGDGLTWLCRST